MGPASARTKPCNIPSWQVGPGAIGGSQVGAVPGWFLYRVGISFQVWGQGQAPGHGRLTAGDWGVCSLARRRGIATVAVTTAQNIVGGVFVYCLKHSKPMQDVAPRAYVSGASCKHVSSSAARGGRTAPEQSGK